MRVRGLPLIFFIFSLCFFVNKAQAQITAGAVSGTISACVGTASFSPNLQQFTITGNGLLPSITATAPANFEISLSPGSGYVPNLTFPSTGVTMYVRAAATAPLGAISGNMVLTASGAATQNVGVTGTVNALPTVNAVGDQTVAVGAPTTAVNFTGTGQVYSWTNNTPGIGLIASGSGDIPSFTALNTGNTAVTATITVTPKPSGFIYTANQNSNNVSVINTGSNMVVATIPVGASPLKTVVSPNGRYIYVQNQQGGSISVIDANTNTVINTITTATINPHDIILSPDGSRLYVVNTTANSVSVVNTSNYNIINTISVGNYPVRSALSPDGAYLYVPCFNSQSVSVINTATNLVETTISGFINTFALLFNHSGSRLYITDRGTNVVAVINTITKTKIATVPVGNYPIGLAITPDDGKIYVANELSNSVSVIDAATNTVTATISADVYCVGITISPDGRYLYSVGAVSHTLSVINTTTNNIDSTIPLTGDLDHPVLSQDASRLYVSDFGVDMVHVINTATNTEITAISTGRDPTIYDFSISPGNGCTGAPITFTITINPPPPTITVVSAPGIVSTYYGTPSIPGSFSLAGVGLTGPVTVTPPAEFEVSTDNINFSPTLTIPANGGALASTLIYSRLRGTTNVGTYAGDIVLSSPGAANVNVAIPNSRVDPQAMNITGAYSKTYGDVIANVTLFYNTPGFTFTNPAFKNGNSFNSIDFTFTAGTGATDKVGLYPKAVTISNLTGRNGYLSSNYTVNYTPIDLVITPAPLTITINKVTKSYGTALTTTTGVTSFTPTGLKNGETVGSVTVNYGAGAAANAAPGIYPGSVVASLVTGGTFSPANYTIDYVNAVLEVTPPPVITALTTPQAVTTEYGTPSSPANFTISATNLISGVLVTPPPGFEVSTNNVTFSSTVTVGSAGSITSVPVYIRLAAITNVGGYNGNIVLTSGATTTNVMMPNSIVSPAPLTLAAIDETKYYGGILTEPASSNRFTITAGSLKNGNTITGVAFTYGLGKAATVKIGTYTGSVNITGVNGANGFLASNYAIIYTPANIIIEPRPLTIIAFNASKIYGETLTGGPGSIAFISQGLQNGETVNGVTLTYAAGGAAKDNAGSYVGKIEMSDPVGVTFVASNYTIDYVFGDLTVNPAPLTIAAVDTSREYDAANPVFKATYIGFINGDSEAVLTKQPTISTTATIMSDGGKYPINATGAAAANYTITYVNGVLTIVPPVGLVIPNTFTPNYDGINDTWKIPALASYPDCMVRVFNRYGTVVYSSIGYGTPWDGTVKGQGVPVGVYYYIIDTKVAGIKASGSLTVIR